MQSYADTLAHKFKCLHWRRLFVLIQHRSINQALVSCFVVMLRIVLIVFTATGFATCSIKESAADSDADLDVDGDDTLEYGKAQYTEADIIPCSGEDQGEAREREALRGAVLKYEAKLPTTVTVAWYLTMVLLCCTYVSLISCVNQY